MGFYQHSDEVIEAARILKQELLDDSPYGNEGDAKDWFYQNYAKVAALAAQTTESEERRAGGDP